jgi:hypothetical protein
MDELVAIGLVIIGGPVGDDDGALLLVEAGEEEEIRSRLSDDPWARSLLLQIDKIEPWQIWLDGRVGTV